MDQWHLYTNFDDQARAVKDVLSLPRFIQNHRCFLLILACINFMNLSTARSAQRAKEVGIRKTMGSSRGQLIRQFIWESLMMTCIALIFSIIIALIALPEFNLLAGKQLSIPFLHFTFWICLLGFALVTGFMAGIYPAFFLSGFGPIKVLKGDFRIGKFSSLLRKTMVVGQFTVCIALIIGTVIIYQQIQFAKDRTVGYNTQRLIISEMKSDSIRKHFAALRMISANWCRRDAVLFRPSTEIKGP
jgi:hypothetical protein